MLATPCRKNLYWQHLVAQGSIIVTVWKSEVNLLLWITNHYDKCFPIFDCDCDPHQLILTLFRPAYLLLHLYTGYAGWPVALALSAMLSTFFIRILSQSGS